MFCNLAFYELLLRFSCQVCLIASYIIFFQTLLYVMFDIPSCQYALELQCETINVSCKIPRNFHVCNWKFIKNLLVEVVELWSHDKGLTSLPTSQPRVGTPIEPFLMRASVWVHVFKSNFLSLSLKFGYCGHNSNDVFKYLT